PDDRLDAGGPRRLVKAGRAVDAVAIEEGQGRIAEIAAAIDEGFGQRRALQKAEGGCGVQLDVGGERRHGFTTMDTKDTKDTKEKHIKNNCLCVLCVLCG